MEYPNDVLIYDIECGTHNYTFKESHLHSFRLFGAYSFKFKKYFILENLADAQKLIDKHRFVVGFNNIGYDDVVLKANGIKYKYKIVIDLKKLIDQRKGSVMWKGKPLAYALERMSLDFITRALDLVDDTTAKDDLDYTILNRAIPEWTIQEKQKIYQYTKRDIEITKKLWEWVVNQFDSWKHHLTQQDQNKLRHLYVAPSVYSYKVLCNKAGVEETYSNEKTQSRLKEGGYVAYPAIERIEGNLYCMDYASLYPHIMIQCNLFGRVQDPTAWHGNNKFKILGYYNKDTMSKMSSVIFDMYKERKALKKAGDPREYGLKIAMNTAYGIMRNPAFSAVYDPVIGNDCCLLAQQWAKLARQRYMEAGYFVFYTDTDSVYLEDKEDNQGKLLTVTKNIIKEINANVPFPVDTFDMDIDYKIEYIQFFHGGNEKDDEKLDQEDIVNKKLGLMKKNYLFVYKDKKGEKQVMLKNLGIVKRSNTKLSKRIFWEKIVPLIKREHKCKFHKSKLLIWINEYMNEDIMLLAKRYNVRDLDTYKSKSCIQAQICAYKPKGAKESLGRGIHFLLPNKTLGAGKGKRKYCTLEEYNKYLRRSDLDINVVLSELEYFNKDHAIKGVDVNQSGLGTWF